MVQGTLLVWENYIFEYDKTMESGGDAYYVAIPGTVVYTFTNRDGKLFWELAKEQSRKFPFTECKTANDDMYKIYESINTV